MNRSFSYTIILLFISFLSVYSIDNKTSTDTCTPNYSQIYDFQIDDVFQYREISTSSAGGSNPTTEILTQYKVYDKTKAGNETVISIAGWKRISSFYNPVNNSTLVTDTTITIEYINEDLLFIDSISNYLNQCHKELIPLNIELINDLGIENIYTRVQAFTSKEATTKSIGGQGNLYELKENDSLIDFHDIVYEDVYKKGLGLVRHEFSFFEMRDIKELQAYVKNGDTVGIILNEEYPDYSPLGHTANSVEQVYDNPLFYPNPVNKVLYFDNEVYNVQISTVSGKKVYDNIKCSEIEVSNFERGVYILILVDVHGKLHTSTLIIN